MPTIKLPSNKLICGALASLVLLPISAVGSDIDNITNLFQADFKDLTSDLGAALSYKAIRPAEPMGSLGFDIGFEVTSTKMESDALEKATTGNAPSKLLVPKLHISKGLPFGFDVGAFYTSVPSSNIGLVGGELSYALFEGGVVSPAISVRAK